jgi:hypothetical protein
MAPASRIWFIEAILSMQRKEARIVAWDDTKQVLEYGE